LSTAKQQPVFQERYDKHVWRACGLDTFGSGLRLALTNAFSRKQMPKPATNPHQQHLFESENRAEPAYRSALARAYRVLARRPRSKQQLRDKLMATAEFSEEIIDRVIAHCEEKKYIDDLEFARRFVQTRLTTRPAGRRLMEMELRKRGLEPHVISVALEEAYAARVEITLANQLAEKQRQRLMTMPVAKARSRLNNLLLRRGFDWETIHQVELWRELAAKMFEP